MSSVNLAHASMRRSGAKPVAASPRQNIALTGFMAVGKSVVGQRLARKLKRSFVDLDRTVEEKERMKVRKIFEHKGEAYFRRMEKKALREVLRQDGQVIATGGGIVADPANLKLLKEKSLLICLTAPVTTLLQRSGGGEERPLLGSADRHKRIHELLSQREKSYGQAHFTIDTEKLSVDQVVQKIMNILQSEERKVRRA